MPHNTPIAYFLTWTAYGTWLPGDTRGWVEYRNGFQLPNPILELESAARMTEDACRLTLHQRQEVEGQVVETCAHREWFLHAINCRTNHVHVVLSSPTPPKIIRAQLKAWCTRRLNEGQQEERENWWTERGSIRWIFTKSKLAETIAYVIVEQDNSLRFQEPEA